jgi:hypothetical protein
MFQVMNQTVFSKGLRNSLPSAFALAAATILSLGTMNGQTQSTPAPGTAPMSTTAAPGTVAVHGAGVQALATDAITKYDNRYEIYGGFNYANGQAGQDLAKHYNMGGGEVMGTYWFGPVRLLKIPNNHLGVIADYRFDAGTSPVFPSAVAFGLNRILIYQNILSGGLQYRWIKNRYAALDLHVLAGATHGTFDTAITGYPATHTTVPGDPPVSQRPTTENVGVYSNRTAGWGAAGGSIDFNYSPKVAIRLQPDITFEHFGTETREFFSISAGLVYRLGKRK